MRWQHKIKIDSEDSILLHSSNMQIKIDVSVTAAVHDILTLCLLLENRLASQQLEFTSAPTDTSSTNELATTMLVTTNLFCARTISG